MYSLCCTPLNKSYSYEECCLFTSHVTRSRELDGDERPHDGTRVRLSDETRPLVARVSMTWSMFATYVCVCAQLHSARGGGVAPRALLLQLRFRTEQQRGAARSSRCVYYSVYVNYLNIYELHSYVRSTRTATFYNELVH